MKKINLTSKALIAKYANLNSIKNILKRYNDLSKISEEIFPQDYQQENLDLNQFFINENFEYVIDFISDKCFEVQKGKIYLKNKYFDFFVKTNSFIDFDFFYLNYLLKKSNIIEFKKRVKFIENSACFNYFINSNLKYKLNEISDIHVHLSGMVPYELILNEIFKEESENLLYKLFVVTENFLINFIYFKNSGLLNDYKIINKFLDFLYVILIDNDKYMSQDFQKVLYEDCEYYIKSSIRLFTKDCVFNLKNPFLNEAVKNFLQGNVNVGDKLIVITFLNLLKKDFSKDSNIDKIIEIYFIVRNLLKNEFVQKFYKEGLEYFSRTFGNKLKKEYLKNNALSNYLKYYKIDNKKINYEVRFYFDDAVKIHNLFYSFLDIKDKYNINIKSIFHYKKSDNLEELSELNFKLTKELFNLINDVNLRFYFKKENTIDLVKKFFHGIDVASRELKSKPEHFSAVYNFFKKSLLASGFFSIDYDCEMKFDEINLQFTYHVGEDFRDLISGLRSIVEAIIFLDLKNEDRLGHGVVLGIDPKIFYSRREVINLSKGEYLDNLTFLYFIFTEIYDFHNNLDLIPINKIKNEILILSKELYGENYTFDDLVDAWLLRRNNYFSIKKENRERLKYSPNNDINIFNFFDEFEKEYFKYSLIDFFEEDLVIERYRSARLNKTAFEILKKYHENIFEFYKITNENICHEMIEFDYSFYELLQDIIMECFVAKRNLFVEILPTSNLLITSINYYEEHPFLRLYPVNLNEYNKFNIRTKKIPIVVGSDNPGVQNTNIMLEYEIIYKILLEKYGEELADKHIYDINKYGNYLFNKD